MLKQIYVYIGLEADNNEKDLNLKSKYKNKICQRLHPKLVGRSFYLKS